MKFHHFKLMLVIAASFIFSSNFIACKGKKTDAELQSEITSKIHQESAMSGLSASVNDGVVTLTGECKDEECRKHCADEVKDMKGVKDVVNNIQIASVQNSNATTTAPVEISSDETLKASVNGTIKDYKNVEADVKDGVIVLRGSIERDNLQNLIISLNALKPKKIDNQLVIK